MEICQFKVCIQKDSLLTQKVPISSLGRSTWSLFSTLSSAIDEVICSKLISHQKHCTAGNSLFSYFVFFFLNFKEWVDEVLNISVFFWELNFDCCIQTANCYSFHHTTKNKKRQKWDSSPRVQFLMIWQSVPLTTRPFCL